MKRRSIPRPVLMMTLLLLMALIPVAAWNAVAAVSPDLSGAQTEAELGGLATQTSLRIMAWTEPAELTAMLLPPLTPDEQGHLAQAETLAKMALNNRPDNAAALTLLGRLAWIGGRPADAQSYYQRALSYQPGETEALLGMADLSLDRRDAANAQAFLKGIRATDQKALDAVAIRSGSLALWRLDGGGALAALTGAHPEAGEDVLPFLWVLAKAYAVQGDFATAAALFNREIPLGERVLWSEQSALAIWAEGSAANSLVELDGAISAAPAYAPAHWEKSLVLMELNRPAEAVAALNKASVKSGGLLRGYLFLLGLAKEAAKDQAGAIKAYSDLVAKNQRLGQAYYLLGRAYYAGGRFSESLRYLGLGIKYSPKLACLYLQRAEVYTRLKMKKQADRDRQSAAGIKLTAEARGWQLQLRTALSAGASPVVLVSLTGGNSASLRGAFISRDGLRWLWYPWHGSPIALALAGAYAGQPLYVLPDAKDDTEPLMAVIPPARPSDNLPPVITQPPAVSQGEGEVYLTWQTNEPARGLASVWPNGAGETAAAKVEEEGYTLWHRLYLGDLPARDYLLRLRVADIHGNQALSELIAFRVAAPVYTLSGQFNIDGGAAQVNLRRVTLNLSLNGDVPGATVRIANEDGIFSGWMPYSPVMSWDLSQGDGQKTVMVQFRRGAAYSPINMADVILDTRPPVIYGVLIPSTGETESTLTWQTDEPSDARVDIRSGAGWYGAFVANDFSTDRRAWLTNLQPGTTYALRIIAADPAGNRSVYEPVTITTNQLADYAAPAGAIQINGGAQYTNSIYVTLSVSGSDTGSGLRDMAFSNDGQLWSMPEPFAGTVSWRLTPGDGLKTVYLRLTDRAGNVSGAFWAQITLDSQPPSISGQTGSLQTGGGLLVSWHTSEPALGQLQVSTSGLFPAPDPMQAQEQDFKVDHLVRQTIPNNTDLIYFRVVVWDQAGNQALGATRSLAATPPDLTGPTGGLRIDDGSPFTRDQGVYLYIWAEDPGRVAQMRLRNAGGNWGDWESYATGRYWTLAAGDGEKEVQIRFRDSYGNESATFLARVQLDTRAPVIQGLAYTQIDARAVLIRWRTDEPSTGTVYYQRAGGGYEYGQGEAGTVPDYGHEVRLIGLEPGVDYRARAAATDRAGNTLSSPEFVLRLTAHDQTPPAGRITINNGAAFTNSAQVTLGLSASDPEGAVTLMSFSNDGRIWSPDEAYRTSRVYTLSGGDGLKTIQVRFRNGAGLYSDPASAQITLDTRTPSISGIIAAPLSADSVELRWRTDEPTYGIVRYGSAVRSYDASGAEDRGSLPQTTPGYALDHRVVLNRLAAGRLYYAAIEAIDRADNRAVSAEFTFNLAAPNKPPTGSLRINSGEAFTKSIQVNLELTASDPDGAVSKMSFSNDGRTWSPDEPFASSRIYSLPAGDGRKTVYARFRDQAGQYSEPAADSIVLDTRPAVISGVVWTQVPADTVELKWRTDEPTYGVVRYGSSPRNYDAGVSEDRAVLTQSPPGFTLDHRVLLPRLLAGRTYYAVIQAIDQAGNQAATPEFTLSLAAANKPPVGSISINGGAPFTKSPQVTLGLSASDPDGAVASMSFSNDGRAWSPDEPYAASRAYGLPGGDGRKTVYARFRDRAGLYSEPVSASIALDTRPAAISGLVWTQVAADTMELRWHTDEPTFGVVRYGTAVRVYSASGAEDRAAFPQATAGYGLDHRVLLSRLVPGTAYFAVIQAIDQANNETTSPEFTFTMPGGVNQPPSGNISINAGARFTNSRTVSLTLSASDPDGKVTAMSLSADNENWTADEPYRTGRSYELTAGDGQKTVHVRFKDQAGSYSRPVSAVIILDTISPSLGEIKISILDKERVELTWRTSEPAWCEIRFGRETKKLTESQSEKGNRSSGTYILEHRLVLEDLRPGGYYFAINAYDQAGNLAVSSESRFDLNGGAPSVNSPASGINVAGSANGGKASGSPIKNLGAGPEAAIDGRDNTGWFYTPLGGGSPSPYWQVDFKQTYRLNKLQLLYAGPAAFRIEYRTGGQWKAAYVVTNENLKAFTRGQRSNGLMDLEFNLGLEAEAIRIVWQDLPPKSDIKLFEARAII